MERLKKKQLEQFKLLKQMKQFQHRTALRTLIKNSQSMQIALKYSEEYLMKSHVESLSEFTPVQISRLVFDRQLEEIKGEFMKLPDEEARIQEFIIVMLKVMKFPFEKTPLYSVGLKDMFYQIAEEGSHVIKYQALFKYILGQLVTMKEEEQNTEFQVRLIERKKQDYLLHDNGIKHVYYSKDLKMVFSLDERSNSIKFYDQDMKNVNKFTPKKEKHLNRYPHVLDFDYSEITQRVGVVLSDQTLSIVHLPNLLTKTEAEFDAQPMNQIVYFLPQKMRRIFFVQMMNKWLTVSEEANRIYLFDMQRIRTQPQKVQSRLKINLNEQQFLTILEVVQLSCICVVAGNEVSFYNQNFSEVKFKKFTHHDQIRHFRYSDQKNQFYLCGLQKNITSFSINRSGVPSRIQTFATSKPIMDFQLFPFFDTIVVLDENNDMRLMQQSTRMVYQQINYSHIVKEKDKFINITKISKNQFAVYQTYMIVIMQEKIAIERDIQYSFLPYSYFDQQKEEMYVSVNHQIISFNLMSGEIRKNYSLQASNIQKHHCFFIGPKTPLFVLDKELNLYQAYHNDQMGEGEYQNYRKKMNVDAVGQCFYDHDLGTFIVVSKDTITQVRNDKHNNFNTLNAITFEGFSNITHSCFCPSQKVLTLLTADQLVYQLHNHSYHFTHCHKFIFPRDPTSHEDRFITQLHYDSLYDLFVIFSNKNQLYFVQRHTHRQVYFNINANMPAKLKEQKFIAFKYQIIKNDKGIADPYILVHDQQGFLVQFSMSSIYQQHGIEVKRGEHAVKAMFKDTQTVTNQNIEATIVILSQTNSIMRTYQQIGLLKAHEKQIAMALKVKLEIVVTLTISIDGYIRLWNNKYQLLFSLKIPSLLKVTWNMKEIEEIKNKKSIQQVLTIYKKYYQDVIDEHSSPVQMCSKSKRLKKQQVQQIPKINLRDPIKIDFQNKDLEEIVMQKEDYRTFYSKDNKFKTQGLFNTTSKVYPHPWRRRKQFLHLFEKASPANKYNIKIPNNLVGLRTSLDMIQKVQPKPDYQEAQKLLPQLTMYQPERGLSERKPKKTVDNEEEEQTFQSCLYVKTQKRKKKINEFDEIDKEFKKKEMMLTARKWVPKKRKDKNKSTAEMKSEIVGHTSEGKVDPLKAIQRIFESHNRECLQSNKGRMIRIPKISIQRDLF